MKKSHSRISSGNVASFMNSGMKVQQALVSNPKMALPLGTQTLFAHSSSNSNLALAATHSNPQTLRDLKSKGTYYEQRRQPSSLAGSLTKRELQPCGQYSDLTKMLSQNNSKGGSTEASNQMYDSNPINDGIATSRPTGMHKYTKSESKYNKGDVAKSPELGFRIDEAPSHRKFYQEAQSSQRNPIGKYTYGTSNGQSISPTKQVYTYNHNNIVNIFLQPNQDSYKDQNIVIKTEADRFATSGTNSGLGHQDYPLSGKITSKKATSPHDIQFISQDNRGDMKHNSANASPLRSVKKDDYNNPIRCNL